MYENLTAYFNTYYNAKKIFDDAVTELKAAPARDRDTNFFAAYNPGAPTLKKFDSVIVKCSKLIQFYPQSAYVDDAILMIGESYEYSGESESAIRKFNELLDNFPKSDLRFEARLWTAKAEYHQNKDDDALKILKDLFPELRAEGKNDFLLESLMLQAQIYIERKEYDQAQQVYALAVEVPGDDAMRAVSQFQLGTMLDSLGQKDKASEAYLSVTKYNPTFTMEFRARLRAGMTLTASGHPDAALKIYDKLNGERLKPEEHGLVDLEIANAYRALGDTTTAFPIYGMIDTTYKHSEASTKSMFARGGYYETVLHDYKLARLFYTKSRLENASPDIGPAVQRKADDFNRYFVLLDNYNRYTTALTPDSGNAPFASGDTVLVGPPTETTPTFADNSLAGFNNNSSFRSPDGGLPGLDRSGTSGGYAGNSEAYRRRHIDRDLDPDDGDETTSTSLTSSSADSLASSKGDSTKNFLRTKSLGRSVRLSVDSVHALLAQTCYEFGTLFFLQIGNKDSSHYWFNRLLSDYPASPYVPKTYYALAELYATNNDTVSADSIRSIIRTKFRNSEYARRLTSPATASGDWQKDSLDVLYAAAESTLVAGDTLRALGEFKDLALETPAHHLTAKATYAVGWIYENLVRDNDSAAAWYKLMLRKDSTSAYASVAKPKVAVHDKPESLKDYVKVKEIEAPSTEKEKTGRTRLAPDTKKDPDDESVDSEDSDKPDSDEDNSDDSSSDDDDPN